MTKTGAGERLIPLDRQTVRELADWAVRQAGELALLGLPPARRVYTREDGSDGHPGYLSTHFDYLVRRSGLPPIRLHDLRHGAASLTYRATKDLKAVQALLGHSQISITADTYTSLFEQAEREAAEASAQLVPRARTGRSGEPTLNPQGPSQAPGSEAENGKPHP